MKTYDYINCVVIMLPLTVYEGTWATLSSLIAMHHLDGSCMCIGIFLNYCVPKQWYQSQVYV